MKIDLATGLTFSTTALSTDDPAKKQRNQRHARKAYDTVLKMMKKVTLSSADTAELKVNLRQLECDLMALGETF